MGRRQDLQLKLEEILESDQVHFQPPANVSMSYPAIVYEQDYAVSEFASNQPYRYTKRYQLTVIHRDADNPVPDLIAMLPMCVFVRSFRADNLYHKIFNIYF